MGLRAGAENLAPPRFDPRTVQPVGSYYTDYAARPTVNCVTHPFMFLFIDFTCFVDLLCSCLLISLVLLIYSVPVLSQGILLSLGEERTRVKFVCLQQSRFVSCASAPTAVRLYVKFL